MNCASDLTSESTPQKSLFCALPTAVLKPVPTGSIKTRSERSSKHSGLSSNLYGAGGVIPAFTVATLRGANEPMCSQSEEAPGPPLYKNETGRVLGSFTSLRVYAVEYTSATGAPFSSFSKIVCAVAL